jgi:hypothetical protein
VLPPNVDANIADTKRLDEHRSLRDRLDTIPGPGSRAATHEQVVVVANGSIKNVPTVR